MPLRVKLAAALLQLGLDPADVEWDHFPALALRVWDGVDTIPPANDPNYIVPRASIAHGVKTSGSPTRARAEGDQHEIAKTKRLAASHSAFRERILKKEPGRESLRPKARIQSRGFPKRG